MAHSSRFFEVKSLLDICVDTLSKLLKDDFMENFEMILTIPDAYVVTKILRNSHVVLVEKLINDKSFKVKYDKCLKSIPKEVVTNVEKTIHQREEQRNFYLSCR